MSEQEPTVGETITRAAFNPSKDDAVEAIKKAGADFIEALAAIERFSEDTRHILAIAHHSRLIPRAVEHAETAVMLAVKHITAKRREPKGKPHLHLPAAE